MAPVRSPQPALSYVCPSRRLTVRTARHRRGPAPAARQVASWYKAGETYDTVFAGFSSALEECKAESVGVYLCLDRRVYPIFGHTDDAAIDDIIYINWLNMVRTARGRRSGHAPTHLVRCRPAASLRVSRRGLLAVPGRPAGAGLLYPGDPVLAPGPHAGAARDTQVRLPVRPAAAHPQD